MRAIAMVAGLALALAATVEAQAPGAPPSYPAAPANLSAPARFDLDTVTQAKGNLYRWRDRTEKVMDASPKKAVPGVTPATDAQTWRFNDLGGYFAYWGDARNPAGVVHGIWHPSSTGRGGRLYVSYVDPPRVCGAPAAYPVLPVEEPAWLGVEWRAEFADLDRALRGGAPPTVQGGAPDQKVRMETPPEAHLLAEAYPSRALRAKVEAEVRLACLVMLSRNLKCGVADEGSPGYGFGDATRRVFESRRVVAAETMADGQPSTGRCATFVVHFKLP